jgi:hypothetical protein
MCKYIGLSAGCDETVIGFGNGVDGWTLNGYCDERGRLSMQTGLGYAWTSSLDGEFGGACDIEIAEKAVSICGGWQKHMGMSLRCVK